MRKLASIKRITNIQPIANADAIELASVGGWYVVVKKNEYNINDLVIYVEIDSWIPHELAPFLSKGQEPKEYDGVKGERLRSIKLRGQLSQGLLLSLSVVAVYNEKDCNWYVENSVDYLIEGDDVTDFLGIKKWEAPIPAQLSGKIIGAFPNYIPKTDQERIQNLSNELDQWKTLNYHWEVSEKLDGTSMTVFLNKDKQFGVCGRNWQLSDSDDNSLWRVVRNNDMENKIRTLNKSYAFQGELIGEGIQGNPYKLKGQAFYVYDIYDIETEKYLSSQERLKIVSDINFSHVPIINDNESLNGVTIENLLYGAENKSVLNASTEREGLVYKCLENPDLSFKAISNKFLLKNNG